MATILVYIWKNGNTPYIYNPYIYKVKNKALFRLFSFNRGHVHT